MKRIFAPLALMAISVACLTWKPAAKEVEPESPSPTEKAKDADSVELYWEALARRIESRRITDTHRIVQIADLAVQWGDIPDRGRLAPLASTDAVQITDENRAELASLVRGEKK